MATTIAVGPDLTAADLDELPADGRRWELIRGVLHVSPAPTGPHQIVVRNLLLLLHAARPAGTAVLPAPFDYRPGDSTSLQPDLLVVVADEASKARTAVPPMLVAEVLSPSTRADDLGTKRLVYEELGVPAYWLVDPDGPSVTVLQLDHGRYVEVASAGRGEVVQLDVPFPVVLPVDQLLDV